MRYFNNILFGASCSLVCGVELSAFAHNSTEPPFPVEQPADGGVADAPTKGEVKGAHGASPSKIKATKTHAALKLVVVDKEKGPIPGITISVKGSKDGKKLYTEATDSTGYTELLVPVGQEYTIVYMSLGFTETAATLPIDGAPNQNVRLTLRYTRILPKGPAGAAPGIVLSGVTFDTADSTIRPESFPQLDQVVEYLTHKPDARVIVSGHTDNVGNKAANKSLSKKRAQACVDYLVKKGIERTRLEAVGYGDERPVASNDTSEGREQNRRIEAQER
jgi:outer membrane protein OmpA-like peptidoglycan-associated protein